MSISRFISPAEANELMQHVRISQSTFAPRNEALLALLYGSGLMLSELAALNVGQVYATGGAVREEFHIDALTKGEPSKPVYLSHPRLRQALAAYRDWRPVHFAGGKVGATGKSAKAPLFVDDAGIGFKLAHTRTGGQGKTYHSYPTLSKLVRDLHTHAGVHGGNAESARRSWSVWMVAGSDGGAPMHLDWVRVLRGDKRLSTTLMAVRKDLPADFDVQGLQPLGRFMRMRSAAIA